MRLEQIVEPGSPRAFFESDPQSSAQSREELQDGCCLRFQYGFHDNLALGIHHRHGDRYLINIEPTILFTDHRACSFARWSCATMTTDCKWAPSCRGVSSLDRSSATPASPVPRTK